METTYKVGDFTFTDQESALAARKELRQVEHLKSQINLKDRQMCAKIYKQIVAQKIFKTPVGFAFTNELRELAGITSAPVVKKEDLTKTKYERPENVVTKQEVVHPSDYNDIEDKNALRLISSLKKQVNKLKKVNFTLKVAVGIMVTIIIGMFIINSTIDSPTILNYREEVIDEYSEWEQELELREKALEKAEQNL